MTILIISLFSLLFLFVLALPFIDETIVEPLPDRGDPVRRELEEARDSLMAAIHELREREDLTKARRDALNTRYEAKAAQVLAQLDRLQQPQQKSFTSRRVPTSLMLLGVLSVPSLALIGSYVLPRVSQDATVTTNRDSDIRLGRDLQRQQRAVRRDPSAENLLRLADTYWQLANQSLMALSQNTGGLPMDQSPRYLEETSATYQRIVEEVNPVPSVAYRRLGFLQLIGNKPREALPYLQQAVLADPADMEAQYSLGEVQYYLGDMTAARQAFEVVAQSDQIQQEAAQTYLQRSQELEPYVIALNEERSATTIVALADAYWRLEERNRAANLYAEALTDYSLEDAHVTSRVGQAIFFSGDAARAVVVLENARRLDPDHLDTLLFLGNAYYSLTEDQRAIEVWNQYVQRAGGSEQAGRVPQLIAQAEARLRGETPSTAGSTITQSNSALTAAPALYSANCATCHGANAQGGVGPALLGNTRLTNEERVRSVITFGRGMMPGFGSLLSSDELEQLVTFVTDLAKED